MLNLAPQVLQHPPQKHTPKPAGRFPYRTETYAKVFELSRTQPTAVACRSCGVSRSGYYNWLSR